MGRLSTAGVIGTVTAKGSLLRLGLDEGLAVFALLPQPLLVPWSRSMLTTCGGNTMALLVSDINSRALLLLRDVTELSALRL